MELVATYNQIIIDKIAILYPSFRVKAIFKKGEEFIVDIYHDINEPGSGLNQKWVVEDNKAVFLGTIPKQSSYFK
jgi:hypothetical protein